MEPKHARALSIYYCGREACTKAHQFGPAIRQHYLIHIILSGRGRFYDGTKLHHLEAGQAFLIEPGAVTYYRASSTAPWEYAWVGFEGYEAAEILRSCGFLNGSSIYTSTNPALLKAAALRLSDTFQSQSYNRYESLSHLYAIFSLMAESVRAEAAPEYKSAYIDSAKYYIQHNYGYDIKISDIARYVGIDRTYLFKLFKEEEQKSPQDYLIDFRIKAAMNMLGNPAFSVTEIAFSCGFKDTPSFCRHFKKRIGQSPLQYRKNNISLPYSR